MSEALVSTLTRMILDGDRYEATELVTEYATEFGFDKAITQLLEPVLRSFGRMWESGEPLSLGQAYVAGKVTEDLVKLIEEKELKDNIHRSLKGPIVIGNILDDTHALGRKLVSVFLRLDGWQIFDLGIDVLIEDFVEKAVEENAPIIAVSAMMFRTAKNISLLRKELDKRGLSGKVQLAVGGAVFIQRPELVDEVGGDGTTNHAIDAPRLMTDLLARSMEARSNE